MIVDFELPAWEVAEPVNIAVHEWLRWVLRWDIDRPTARKTLCRRCTGSPLNVAAGFHSDVPHQVRHPLIIRIQKLIDKRVDSIIETKLPLLHAELHGGEEWEANGGFDPRANLAPEYDEEHLDPVANAAAPFLFTIAELADSTAPAVKLPRPPLTEAEKMQLRKEIAISDAVAFDAGQTAALELTKHQKIIADALGQYVMPQIDSMLQRLSDSLFFPDL